MYQKSIHVKIKVFCVIYKLAHHVNFLVCNKLFIIGEFIVSLVHHEFVGVINITLKKLISCMVGSKMTSMMEEFKQWCGLQNVPCAIANTHIPSSRPFFHFAK
jgi:hypothetical protein